MGKKSNAWRDGRLTMLLVFGGVFLVFHAAGVLYSPSGLSGSADLQCRELRVIDGVHLQVHACSNSDGPVEDVGVPAPFTPFFFRPVKINYADRDMLMTVKGIGPSLADRILAHRKSFGPFKGIGDLQNLKGVGRKRAATLAAQLTFDEEQ